jgi:CRP-like cAMP-binding protein
MRTVLRGVADWSWRAFSVAGRLAPDDLSLFEKLLGEPQARRAGDWIEDQAVPFGCAWLVVSGWAAQARMLADGRRQLGRILVSGDVSGLSQSAGPPPCGVLALTDVLVVDLGALRDAVIAGRSRGLARAWAAMQKAEQNDAFAQIMRLGRFTAYERTGHLLLELHDRLEAVGLTHGSSMPMPLTQEMLADCLGLSVVHLNRMIQQLRRSRLISSELRKITFLDRARLAEECHYGPPAHLSAPAALQA